MSSSCVSRAITWTDTCSSLSGHSVRPIVASSAVAVEWEISPAQSESETIDRGPAFAYVTAAGPPTAGHVHTSRTSPARRSSHGGAFSNPGSFCGRLPR